jgi:hypothetical protein
VAKEKPPAVVTMLRDALVKARDLKEASIIFKSIDSIYPDKTEETWRSIAPKVGADWLASLLKQEQELWILSAPSNPLSIKLQANQQKLAIDGGLIDPHQVFETIDGMAQDNLAPPYSWLYASLRALRNLSYYEARESVLEIMKMQPKWSNAARSQAVAILLENESTVKIGMEVLVSGIDPFSEVFKKQKIKRGRTGALIEGAALSGLLSGRDLAYCMAAADTPEKRQNLFIWVLRSYNPNTAIMTNRIEKRELVGMAKRCGNDGANFKIIKAILLDIIARPSWDAFGVELLKSVGRSDTNQMTQHKTDFAETANFLAVINNYNFCDKKEIEGIHYMKEEVLEKMKSRCATLEKQLELLNGPWMAAVLTAESLQLIKEFCPIFEKAHKEKNLRNRDVLRQEMDILLAMPVPPVRVQKARL